MNLVALLARRASTIIDDLGRRCGIIEKQFV